MTFVDLLLSIFDLFVDCFFSPVFLTDVDVHYLTQIVNSDVLRVAVLTSLNNIIALCESDFFPLIFSFPRPSSLCVIVPFGYCSH